MKSDLPVDMRDALRRSAGEALISGGEPAVNPLQLLALVDMADRAATAPDHIEQLLADQCAEIKFLGELANDMIGIIGECAVLPREGALAKVKDVLVHRLARVAGEVGVAAEHARVDPSPPSLAIVWHDTPEAVHRAMWEPVAIENDISYAELVASMSAGTTEGGEEIEFSHEQEIDGIRAQGCWGFLDTKANTIHAWAGEKADPVTVLHMLAHEVGHATGVPHPDDMQEEMRAEQFGRVAAMAYEFLNARVACPAPGIAHIREQALLDAETVVRRSFDRGDSIWSHGFNAGVRRSLESIKAMPERHASSLQRVLAQ